MHDFSRFTCCGTCRQTTHDPKPCVECQKVDRSVRYCNKHRHACVVCGETVCEAHREEHAAMCAKTEKCSDCLGQGYDLASYRRAKNYDEVEDCATCNGSGEVSVRRIDDYADRVRRPGRMFA